MKHLSFKILAFCTLLPPLLYVFSLTALEAYLQHCWQAELQVACTEDTPRLLDGHARLEKVLSRRIDAYLSRQWPLRAGVKAQVMVNTSQGALLYPAAFEGGQKNWQTPDRLSIASANYRLLSQGLEFSVNVIIAHNTLLANLLLLCFIAVGLSALWYFFRAGVKTTQAEAERNKAEMEFLRQVEADAQKQMNALQGQRTHLESQLASIQCELQDVQARADATENEMIEELVHLEDKLHRKKNYQQELETEIAQLKEKLLELGKNEHKNIPAKPRAAESTARRFSVLYKQINVSERAVKGFLELPEEMKIKAEEMIQQLNYEPDIVAVKRKVFAKKNSATVLEAVFAYKGRLYFRKSGTNMVEILAIGTKHTQNKDLASLARL